MLRSLRTFVSLAASMVAGCAGTADAPPGAEHVVLVTVDTLRADRLGAYGHPDARTPNIDLLGEGSVLFERAYAHASMTLPSIASLLTGLLPSQHGVVDNTGSVDESLPILATRLEQAGFSSAAFVGNFALRPGTGVERGFGTYTTSFRAQEGVREHPENRAAELTSEAISWLRGRSDEERLFLWVHYQEPHGAYMSAPAPGSINPGGPVLPRSESDSGFRAIPRYQWLGHGRLRDYEARYQAEIRQVDRQLGRLKDALERTGLLERSVLVFASDHGEAFGEGELYCAHGEGLDEALLRVPLMIRLPQGRGTVRRDRVRLRDLPRTLLELVTVDPSGFGGSSLLVDEGDRQVVAQTRAPWSRRGEQWRACRDGGWELVESLGDQSTLRREPGTPGTGSPGTDREDARERESAGKRLGTCLRQRAPWVVDPSPRTLTEAEIEGLRALGYL